jgi:8-amino-3,8-dideoxy-alpha-D-manno-octulosonate transaminase
MYELPSSTFVKLQEQLASRQYFRYYGQNKKSKCDSFEQNFSKYISDQEFYSIILSSGTNALIAALAALEIGQGDEVIIPVNTFVATALAIRAVGAIPILVNNNSTLTISPKEIEKAITPKTKAIIPVHLDGLCCDLTKITQIAKQHNLYVIEDCAQAIGGKYQGQHLGTWGDFGCFSLNMDKIITAGEGGILITPNKQRYLRAFLTHDPASSFGPTKGPQLKGLPLNYFFSMRVSELSAVMAQEQLNILDSILYRLKKLKTDLITQIKDRNPQLNIPQGYDTDGECSTTLHISYSNAQQVISIVKQLFKINIVAMPLSLRLAHFGWQWKNILPYKFMLPKYLYTLDQATTTIRIPLELTWNSKQLSQLVEIVTSSE